MSCISEHKLSVIIPTLQKNVRVLTMLLNQLISDENTDEIIVIDNSKQGLNIQSDKLRVIIPKENLYVNPAWNLGVKEVKNQYIGIINDDLIFPKNFISKVIDFLILNSDVGIVGLDTIEPTKPDDFDNYPKDTGIEFKKIFERNSCWGSAMFLKKSLYCEIPLEMKVWFGDDFLFEKIKEQKKTNYRIINSNIKHLHSLTSDLNEFDAIKRKDEEIYYKIYPQYRKRNKKLNILQKIFSIKNQYKNCKQHKIITVLGIKIKIEKKK